METAALPLGISLALDQVDATLVANRCAAVASCTKPVYRAPGSARIPHGSRSNISSMDVLAIALGIAMFAILFGLIYAIDRV